MATTSIPKYTLVAELATNAADATLAFKREIFVALIPKYMTTGTATTDASITADAVADTKRLKAAYDELMKVAP